MAAGFIWKQAIVIIYYAQAHDEDVASGSELHAINKNRHNCA